MNLTSNITRDNFDPGKVLQALRLGSMSAHESRRLLEEACHAIARRDALIERARMVAENLRDDLRN